LTIFLKSVVILQDAPVEALSCVGCVTFSACNVGKGSLAMKQILGLVGAGLLFVSLLSCEKPVVTLSIEKPKLLKTIGTQGDSIGSIAYSQDGKTIASVSKDKEIESKIINRHPVDPSMYGTIKLWDVDSGDNTSSIHPSCPFNNQILVFSPDGKTLGSVSQFMQGSGCRGHDAILWDVATGAENVLVDQQEGWVDCMTFSPDGKTLALGGAPGTIKLWNFASGTEPVALTWSIVGEKSEPNTIVSLAFSANGEMLAAGSVGTIDNTDGWDIGDKPVLSPEGGKIYLWNIATRKIIATFSETRGHVMALAFSPDGKILASGIDDSTIKLWDVATGKTMTTLSGGYFTVAFSPDGRILVSGMSGLMDDPIKLWDVGTGAKLANFGDEFCGSYSIQFSPDGKILVAGCADKTIKLFGPITVTTSVQK
jgi:WD40 repeat protein